MALKTLTISELRTEHAVNPLGIDVRRPRFSWKLTGDAAGVWQETYRILAASSPALLQPRAKPDLWDSGEVESDETTFVSYEGPALRSGQRVFWRVMVRDQHGVRTTSPIAWFETGLLEPGDWQGTFISPPCSCTGGRGYHSAVLPVEPPTEFWIQVDLGATNPDPLTQIPDSSSTRTNAVGVHALACPGFESAGQASAFDRIVLHPCFYREQGETGKGFGFPLRFRLDVAQSEEDFCGFRNSVLLYEATEDLPPPGLAPVSIPLPQPVMARYVRLTVAKPVILNGKVTLMALDEFEVFAGARNLALHRPVRVANQLRSTVPAGSYDWHPSCLTDGCVHLDPPVHDDQGPGNLLRKVFEIGKPVERARLYITARGWCEMRLNGEPVTDAVLDPAWTADAKRLLYSTWDVTRLVKSGANVATVQIGFGWPQAPAVLLQLVVEHRDGSRTVLVSDESWQVVPSGLVANSVYHGEAFDARRDDPAVHLPGYVPLATAPVLVHGEYRPELSAQMLPPIRVIESVHPVALAEPQPDVWVFDLGLNIAGWAQLKVQAPAGTRIQMRFGETVFDDGTVWTDAAQTQARREGKLVTVDGALNLANMRSARVTDTYICKGTGAVESWEPRFTFHGFRFVELTGFPGKPELGTITGRVVHTDFASCGEFACSDPVMNWTQAALRLTFRDNFQGFPSDCPQRDERQGWMGDAQVTVEALLCNFDAVGAYRKWLQDIRDCQRADGAVGDTTPFTIGRMGGDVPWGAATVLVAWYAYLYSGDIQILEEHLASMEQFMAFNLARWPDRIVEDNAYGDWLSLEETPKPLTGTAYLYLCAVITAESLRRCAQPERAAALDAIAGEIAVAFNRAFFNPQTGVYATGSQTAQCLALAFGLVPPEQRVAVFAQLAANVEKHGRHVSTGILGTRYLLQVLCDGGRPDLAYDVAQTRDFPGWGFMMQHQATTLWEHWELITGNGMNSHNHPLFGSIGSWFMNYVAGIRPDPEQPGFSHIRFAPVITDRLEFVRGRLETVCGTVACAWSRQGEQVTLDLTVPANCSGTLCLPGDATDFRVVRGTVADLGGHTTDCDGTAPRLFSVVSGQHRLEFAVRSGE